MHKTVEYASKLLELSEIEVLFHTKDKFHHNGVNAVFIENYYGIAFNIDWLSGALPEEVVITALHETRHAYQKANIDFPFIFDGYESKDTITEWKRDFKSYIRPNKNNLNDYIDQSIEKDAIEFSRAIGKSHFGITFLDD